MRTLTHLPRVARPGLRGENTGQSSALCHCSESVYSGVWETETGRMAHVLRRETHLKRQKNQGTG